MQISSVSKHFAIFLMMNLALFIFCDALALAKSEKIPSKTVVSAIIVSKNKSILMIKRAHDYKGADIGKDMWDFVGGRIKSGEELKTALSREVSQEIGVEISSWQLVDAINFEMKKGKNKMNRTQLFYLTNLPEETQLKLTDQHTSFKWFKLSEMSNLQIIEPYQKVLQDLTKQFSDPIAPIKKVK